MTNFIKKLIFFLLTSFVTTYTLLFVTNAIVFSNTNVNKDLIYENIILGHSHSAYAFNDTLIDNFKNISSEGESYFYTYYKLKVMITQNPNIKNAYIEFSNDQILEKRDIWIWGDTYLWSHSTKYTPFLTQKDLFFLFSKNSLGFLKSSLMSLYLNIIRIVSNNYNHDIGNFKAQYGSKVDYIINKRLNRKNFNSKFSSYSLVYLRKIVELCYSKGIKPYLIRSPLHPQSKDLVYEPQFIKIIKENFSDITFLDFRNFKLKNNEMIDLEHLNYNGSIKFSKWFDYLIKLGLLHKKNIQRYIDNNIDKKVYDF